MNIYQIQPVGSGIFKNKYEASLVKTIHKFMNRKFRDASISLEKELQAVTSTLK